MLDRIGKRRGVIAAVEGGARDVRDIRDAVDVARSTVYEATRELEAVGVLARSGNGFELTPFGRSAVEAHDRCLGALDTLCGVRSELAGLEREVTLDPLLCREAEVVRAEPHAPDRPFEAMGEFFEGATRMKGFVPVTGTRYIEGLNEGFDEGLCTLDVVTEERVVGYLLSNHPGAVEQWIDSDRIRLYETESRLPFGLLIEEEPARSIGVLLYDERGQLRVLLRTESRAAVAWGRERFAARLDEAMPLEEARTG